MPKITVVDEAIIDAEPSTVFKAILDELAGNTHWWMPHTESKFRGNTETVNQEGAIIDLTIHDIVTSKFSERFTEIIQDKMIKVEIFEGDFLGNSEWTFEGLNGRTKVRYQWNAEPNRLLLTIFSPFVNIGKIHSKHMQFGFTALNNYLKS
ncbi:MAG: SRPBCC family protein [Candidatus Bathyarchaeota archaeon]|nr:MAG: SRPBCC family protein [Candidatus Bathyarchaeota archaeon]